MTDVRAGAPIGAAALSGCRVADGGVALGTAPVATGACARWWLGDRLGRAWVPAGALSVLGCVMLVGLGGGDGLDPAGVALGVLAGGCHGAYTVAAKRLAPSRAGR